mmetsp:Transcript_53977/g.136376  ORF Transcript_53977/g.136376 Transcript_53977/m.136376 type:complete len:221 (-) Transcript_53977:282-944(-)
MPPARLWHLQRGSRRPPLASSHQALSPQEKRQQRPFGGCPRGAHWTTPPNGRARQWPASAARSAGCLATARPHCCSRQSARPDAPRAPTPRLLSPARAPSLHPEASPPAKGFSASAPPCRSPAPSARPVPGARSARAGPRAARCAAARPRHAPGSRRARRAGRSARPLPGRAAPRGSGTAASSPGRPAAPGGAPQSVPRPGAALPPPFPPGARHCFSATV